MEPPSRLFGARHRGSPSGEFDLRADKITQSPDFTLKPLSPTGVAQIGKRLRVCDLAKYIYRDIDWPPICLNRSP